MHHDAIHIVASLYHMSREADRDQKQARLPDGAHAVRLEKGEERTMPHAGWYMPMYHFLGTYVIAGVTVAYALLALVRLRPHIRLTPKRQKTLVNEEGS